MYDGIKSIHIPADRLWRPDILLGELNIIEFLCNSIIHNEFNSAMFDDEYNWEVIKYTDISEMLNPKKHLPERKEVEENLQLIPQRTEPNLIKCSITRRSHL